MDTWYQFCQELNMKAAKTYVCEAENSSTKYAENTWNEANRTLLFKIQTSEQILKKVK